MQRNWLQDETCYLKCAFGAYANSEGSDQTADLTEPLGAVEYSDSEGSDQTAHLRSLIWAFADRLKNLLIP